MTDSPSAASLSLPTRVAKSLRWRLRARLLIRAKPRHPQAFATHMPALIALGSLVPVRSVLELGSGLHSTPLFLDRDIFPTVSRVVSLEDDAEWAARVREAIGPDDRLELRTVAEVASALSSIDVNDFDLVLIDDSSTGERRAATIRAVAAAKPTGVVVIHDIDIPLYRAAARAMPRRVIFRSFNPQTAIVPGAKASRRSIRRIRRLMDTNANGLAPTDAVAWRDRFAE